MLRKICSVFMALLVALFCLPVSSSAAESDLQNDFDNGLITLKTGFAYHKIGSGYNVLNSFDSTSNNISPYYDFDYVFGKYQNNTLKRYAYRFQISYNDNRVLMPQGEAISFSIHNFYSQFYWGLYDPENFDVTRYMYLDVSKYIDSFVYFVDLAGNSYAVSDDMYEISFNQDEAMITVKLKSDIYDFDVYAIRFYVCFDVNAFYIYQSDIIVGWATDSWYDAYDSFYVSYGYSNLFLEISSDTEAATKGLLTSIIEYIKSIWDSIKNLPQNIKESFTSLFEDLTFSISGFFDFLNNKLAYLFSVFTDEQPTYAPFEEGSSVSDYQNAEDEAMDAAGVGDLDANIDSAFSNADSVFNNNNAYAFISASMEQIVFGNIKISGLVIFSLAMGLCVLVLGRKLNSA